MKRSGIPISMFQNSTLLAGWCRGRRRPRRRRGCIIRLGNKRRGFCMGSRTVVQWGAVVVTPFRIIKKMITELTPSAGFIDAYYSSLLLPLLRPQLFPLC
ncbi:uncharacterized protein LOC110821653 [Carica papaya]|uniref:uncharacterized protein LOC110821653 n=1 Tax=Carica papaya TaxID=3649 RepID=UPI000B8C8DE8|nr:uncharacterized protein LOC110821653 [Carica papaya]